MSFKWDSRVPNVQKLGVRPIRLKNTTGFCSKYSDTKRRSVNNNAFSSTKLHLFIFFGIIIVSICAKTYEAVTLFGESKYYRKSPL